MQIGARCDAVKLICHLSTLTAREPHVIASGKGDVAATATATATANVAVAAADELRAATSAVDRHWQVEQIGLNMLLATLLPVDSWTATTGAAAICVARPSIVYGHTIIFYAPSAWQ